VSLLDRLRPDRMNSEPFELEAARRMEAVRQCLIKTDPDAARILATNIIDAHMSWKTNAAFTKEVQAYAVAKHAAGQMHLYDSLFVDATEH
jgi:hypothetical protein